MPWGRRGAAGGPAAPGRVKVESHPTQPASQPQPAGKSSSAPWLRSASGNNHAQEPGCQEGKGSGMRRRGGECREENPEPSQKAAKAGIHYPPGDVFIANVSQCPGTGDSDGCVLPIRPRTMAALKPAAPRHAPAPDLGAAPALFWGMPLLQGVPFLHGGAVPERCRSLPCWLLAPGANRAPLGRGHCPWGCWPGPPCIAPMQPGSQPQQVPETWPAESALEMGK